MSEKTIQGIHDAIQAHVDETKGNGEKVADFVVARANFTENGAWNFGYITSSMITPHGTVGLLDQAQMLLQEDLMEPVGDN